jgi:UDP-glucose 4-epimerase
MSGNKKIVVTGAAGFLGSWVSEALVKQGHDVVAVDNLLGGYESNIPPGVRFCKGDAANLDLMTEVTRGADAVYHLAAAPHEGLSVFSPVHVNYHTFTTTAAVCAAAAINQVPRIVFTSSIARYGENKTPFTEDMVPNPKDPYGIAKFASEMLIQRTCEAHGIKYSIAAPHNIIGIRQKYDDPYRNVVSIMANQMLQGKQPVIFGDGQQVRTFSDVRDCVDPLVKMIESGPHLGQIINIGPGPENNATTINELAGMIAAEVGFELHPRYEPDRPQEVKVATASCDKARLLLGYNPTRRIEDTIAEMVSEIKRLGPKPFEWGLRPMEIKTDKTPRVWTNQSL